jgi:hypothetical protein
VKYFAIYDDEKLVSFGKTSAEKPKGEITEAEYDALMAVHTEKRAYAERVYAGEITIDEVPEEYREDVAEMVEQMRIEPEQPMSDIDEALAILSGEVSEND